MNRYRGPTLGGPSKATPSTLCQKCLKRDIYECKAPAQERPYQSRPSRTQQLLNPKLVPRLTSDVPDHLLRKKGIADEELAKKAAERGRKRDREDDDDLPPQRKRSRSASSHSSSSVSTISTNRSRSPSPRPPRSFDQDSYVTSQRNDFPATSKNGKRRRSSSSSRGYHSRSLEDAGDRNTRRRRSSNSPLERGRRRSRSFDSGRRGSKRIESYSRSRSRGRGRDTSRSRSRSKSRGTRGGRDRSTQRRPGWTAQRSPPRRASRSRSPFRYDGRREPHNGVGRMAPDNRQAPPNAVRDGGQAPPPTRKERSLSPFSKRLALTQAMNIGFSR